MIDRKAIQVQESVGLISVRLFTVLLNEACEMLLEGVGKIEDIEELMLTGYGMRFGPFSIADIIGLDRVARWMENLFNEYGDARYKPNPMIKQLIRQNNFGLSTGKGFFSYDEEGVKIENDKCE
jgi:3-hydroxybutyryl-CoA dehydrogenase